jgi:hypothetical protein
MPVKTKPLLRLWRAMAASTRRYLVEGIATAGYVFSLVLLGGNPRSRNSRSDDDGVFSVVYILMTSFLEQLFVGGFGGAASSCTKFLVEMSSHV